MNRVRFVASLCLLASLGQAPGEAPETRGHLVIIGGGKPPPAAMKRFVALAGGVERARIAVIPMAGENPAATGESQARDFRAMGVTNIVTLLLTHDTASHPGAAARLEGVTGIFFTGGDQARLASYVVGTPLQTRLLGLYALGAVLGGSSAGAAFMSEVMITGEQRTNSNSAEKFTQVRRDVVVTAQGLGVVTNAVIDQHFLARKRHNRLLSVVLERPHLLGVGIDEDTAIVVMPDGSFDVVGDGSVLILDARRCTQSRTDAAGNLGTRGLQTHLLLDGDRFDPAVVNPPPPR